MSEGWAAQWQESMFDDRSATFIALLKERKLPGTAQDFFASFRPQDATRYAALDLGCGIGRLSGILANICTLAAGLDYSQPLLIEAQRHAPPNTILLRHDMRAIGTLFPPASFDLIVRAYTSLGYFDRDTELDILRQCRSIAHEGAHLVLDTFNADYFRLHGTQQSVTPYSTFDHHEAYTWNEEEQRTDCVWTYAHHNGKKEEVRFSLSGYTLKSTTDLLQEAGWSITGAWTDFDLSKPLGDTPGARLVVAAKAG